MQREKILQWLDELLQPSSFKDSTFNGLQIEGKNDISKIGFAVDSGLEVFNKAQYARCDMLITHHGMIWGGLDRISGRDRERIKFLLDHNINLYVSHLPLDKNGEVGNNAGIIQLLNAEIKEGFAEVGYIAELKTKISFDVLCEKIKNLINLEANFIFQGNQDWIDNLAVCSGGIKLAHYEEAVKKGIKTVLTGEVMGTSMLYHPAKEDNINLICAGHYQTETIGLRLLMEKMNQVFKGKLETEFLNIPNNW